MTSVKTPIKIEKYLKNFFFIIHVMYTIDCTPYKLSDWLFIPLVQEIWDCLSSNPNAIHLLEQNQDKINWSQLSGNSEAIHLLEQNQDKIDWNLLLQNPSIF